MSRSKVEGTKIAQAAKDLNVTSVTIRRYIQEFNIETATDENGIKVLPGQALEELQEIRRLKEDGLTNPKVLEHLEEMRAGKSEKPKAKAKAKAKPVSKAKAKVAIEVEEVELDEVEEEEEPVRKPKVKATRISAKAKVEELPPVQKEEEEEEKEESSEESDAEGQGNGEERFMHNLTCQTCSKTFEHANPRLRDCLECYRAKRKERRRGGADKHKKVIENPLAQQVLSKTQALAPSESGVERVRERPERQERDRLDRDRLDRPAHLDRPDRPDRPERPERSDRSDRGDRSDRSAAALDRPERIERAPLERSVAARSSEPSSWAQMQKPVRSYRKAIEETRLITGSLKRRLERPDLPEGERRWLEQIYAYQLILHQGWRHLAEYKSGSPTPKPQED